MYSFISPQNEVIKTKTIRAFSDQYGLHYGNARSLACGLRHTIRGWCSTHKNARLKRRRFQTVLVNMRTGEREILGQTVKGFAKAHGLCMNELSKLVNRRKVVYRHWVLESTLKAANIDIAAQKI